MADAVITPAEAATLAALIADLANDTSESHGAAHLGYKPPSGADGSSVKSALDTAKALGTTVSSLSGTVSTMNGNVGAHTGTGSAFAQIATLIADLATAGLDLDAAEIDIAALQVRKGTISVPIFTPDAAAVAIYSGVMVAHRTLTLTGAKLSFVGYPGSVLSDCIFRLTNYDRSASTTHNLLSTDGIVIDALSMYAVVTLTLTDTVADRTLALDDYLFVSVTCGNADAVAGQGGILTLEFDFA